MSPSNEPERFGRYRLITQLGSGGMSTVHLAVAESGPQVGRKLVVLKLLQRHLQDDSDFTKLFVREARIAVEMSHSNVVHTHTVGEQDGRSYILMEYLEGVSLRSIMNICGAWSLRDRLPLFGGLCMALTGLRYVHEFHDHNGQPLNLVHRDIKPDNVFITADGQVKLLDFGVARVESPDFERTLGTSVRGTVQYLSPESVRPDVTVDARADVFSFGVILAELATGRRFWGDEPYTKILASLANSDIPSLEPRPGEEIPPPLARAYEQALKVDRDERFQTANEVRAALLRFLTKQGYRIDSGDLAAIVGPLFEPIRRAREALIQNSLSDLEVSQIVALPASESNTFPGSATMPAIGDRTTPASFLSAPTKDPVEPKPRRIALWTSALLLVPLVGLGAYQCGATDGADARDVPGPADEPGNTSKPVTRAHESSVAVEADAEQPAEVDPAPLPESLDPSTEHRPADPSDPTTTAEPVTQGSQEQDDEPIIAGEGDPEANERRAKKRPRRKPRVSSRPPEPTPAPVPEPKPEPAPVSAVTSPADPPKPAGTKPAGTKPTPIEANPYAR